MTYAGEVQRLLSVAQSVLDAARDLPVTSENLPLLLDALEIILRQANKCAILLDQELLESRLLVRDHNREKEAV